MNYWRDRDKLKAKAVKDTAMRAQKYRSEIVKCVESTQEFKAGVVCVPEPCYSSTELVFEARDSVSSVINAVTQYGGKVCVLNFASYMNPGGKYFEGSCAQEESICHRSILYNVLKSERIIEMFYATHRGNANDSCYTDHLLYTPDVVFDDGAVCDIITCAAPNKGAAMRYKNVDGVKVDEYMHERCSAVLRAAYCNRVDTLILGAFGCGVFKNDPSVVATSFKSLLTGRFANCFERVIFAVPDETNGRYFEAICR